jgi:ribonuclease P protein component
LLYYGEILKRFSFEKSKRLVTNEQFKAVLACKRCISDEVLILYVAENNSGCRRLGISVGKTCGSAVMRNRLKRLLREAFRQSHELLPNGFDYLVMISPKLLKKLDKSADAKMLVKQLTFDQIKSSLINLAATAEKLNT